MKEITILVKKADGTTARVPLSSVKKGATPTPTVAASSEPSAPVAVKPRVAVAVRPAPMAAEPAKKPLPVRAEASDYTSLLEEPVTAPARTAQARTSSPRLDQAAAVLARLSFTVPPEAVNRLRSVVQLYMKEVRTKQQSLEACQRPLSAGGIGLTPEQANEVIEKTKVTVKPEEHAFAPTLHELKKEALMNAPKSLESLPQVVPQAGLPATETPYNGFRHGDKPQQSAVIKKSAVVPAQPKKMPAFHIQDPEMPVFSLQGATAPQRKKPMADISARPIAVGPVDEIRTFSLVDFRRLAPTAPESAARLKQKFVNLKDESIVLYLDALDAWKMSPLYADYTGYLTQALFAATGRPATTNATTIQLPEVSALAAMDKELGV